MEYFRFSSVRDAVALSQMFAVPAFYVKLDISSCYLSFPIRPADYTYFVCAVGDRLLQFTSIVFGDSDAPRKVTLSLDVVSAAIYDRGVAHTRYLDDFWIVGSTAKRAWLCARAHRAAEVISFGLSLSLKKVEARVPAHVWNISASWWTRWPKPFASLKRAWWIFRPV